jgi:hypothetical protein
MRKLSTVFALLPILLIVSYCLSCDLLNTNRCKDAIGNNVMGYTFDIPYTITPIKDTFRVGDTIWLESTFSNQMYNTRNGKTYTVNNFDFKMYGYFLDLRTDPCVGTNEYIMVNELGQLYTTDRNGGDFYFNYKMEDGHYRWKAGFIMKKSGFFAFGPGTDIALTSLNLQSPSQTISNCRPEYVKLNIKRINGSANSYLLHDAADPYIKEPGDFEIFETNCFAFYVKP